MKRTLRQTIMSILLSNATALVIFYLLYRYGVSQDIPLVQRYFMIPLLILTGGLIREDYKQLKICSI
ncbi:hypothetical protein [uncultured Clostridium sp.]|uniref:hypothetical protein n=1 Tax=uncultured Clostridium sp. TaxID=59620 RepID=UPI0025868FFF|nr:hypothetical protein [uncultured Clostridium sp.]MDU1350592.1 hypothetical protein [Clostridium argentinense]